MGATSSIAESKFNIIISIKDIPPVLLKLTNFESIAVKNGQVTIKQLIDALNLWSDVFISHNWGEDQLVHKFVSKVNKALQQLGLTTWFDEERMHGDIRDQMTKGIDQSSLILVFVTKQYMEKVASTNQNDNCKLEFGYAALKKSSEKMIAIVIEEEMLNSSKWYGDLGMILGNKLFIPFVKRDAESFTSTIDIINSKIRNEVTVVKEALESTDWMALINAAEGEEDVAGQCIECGEVATRHCIDCSIDCIADYCDVCCAKVHGMKALQRHNRCSIEEKASLALGTCAPHKEPVTKKMHFCCTCDTLLCPQCIIQGVHSSHNFNICEELSSGSATMDAFQRESDSLLAGLEDRMAKLKKIETNTVSEDNSKIVLIREKFTAIRNALDAKEDQIVTDIRASTKKRLTSVLDSLAQYDVSKWNLIQVAYEAGIKPKTSGVQFLTKSTKLMTTNETLKTTLLENLPLVTPSRLLYKIDENKIISEVNKQHIFYGPSDLLLLFGTGVDGDLVVNTKCYLNSDRTYQYSSVTIESGGVLALNENFNGATGGYLRLMVAGKLEIKAGGMISVSGCGYQGGHQSKGEYYRGLEAVEQGTSEDGGGSGDEATTCPHKWMGSGGYGYDGYDAYGGGYVYLSVNTFENYGEVSSCGTTGEIFGSGSGGTIKIVADSLKAIGKLTANEGEDTGYGKGFRGRIFVEEIFLI